MLAHYVVLTRGVDGCRNVDLVASAGTPGRFLVIEKWDDPDAQRAHLDAPVMVEMATAATPLLAGRARPRPLRGDLRPGPRVGAGPANIASGDTAGVGVLRTRPPHDEVRPGEGQAYGLDDGAEPEA